jgi:hypothetical protein
MTNQPSENRMKAHEICVAAPIDYSHLASLVRRGVLKPVKDGSGDHVFTAEDLAVARAAVETARRR